MVISATKFLFYDDNNDVVHVDVVIFVVVIVVVVIILLLLLLFYADLDCVLKSQDVVSESSIKSLAIGFVLGSLSKKRLLKEQKTK